MGQSTASKANRVPRRVDARDEKQVLDYFSEADVVISAVPWQMNMRLDSKARAGREAAKLIDVGNDPEWFWYRFRKRDEEAKEAGIALVPDCGLAPGMVNHLGLYCMEKMDTCHRAAPALWGAAPTCRWVTLGLQAWCSTYDWWPSRSIRARRWCLREGKPTYLPTLEDIEYHGGIEELGLLEAAPTAGGTSTAPYTLAGKVQGGYDYKTLRYPDTGTSSRPARPGAF